MPKYSRTCLPGHPPNWHKHKKRTLTSAIRINGPFEVVTREGTLSCPDGWLALDTEGWPYPIAAQEFATIYEESD